MSSVASQHGSSPLFLSRLRTVISALLLAVISLDAATAQTPADIQNRISALAATGDKKIAGQSIAAVAYLQELYAARQFQPAWTRTENVSALKEAVATSWMEGLLAEDFHAKALGLGPLGGGVSLTETERDILMSDALVRLLYQLYFGKVSPNSIDSNWNFKRPLLEADAANVISASLTDGTLKDLIEKVRLKHPFYGGLKTTLQAYTEYSVQGGWKAVPEGPALKPGAGDERIRLVRQRLAVTGEYEPEGDQSSPVYDEKLAEAVKKFQREHGLADEGLIGPQTIKALNVTPEQRIDEIRVNLERARWVLREAINEPDMVIVNIPGFYLAVILNGQREWKTDVIVGREYTKTPVFTERMKYLVLNPDWTIPRSIVKGEVIPKAAADPGYLAARNYDLLDSNGARVSPQSVNWSTVSAASFPYSVVQRPGPKNALGQVKFIFPNKYNVYLHDTPSRELFAKSGRTFSHGCIRVKDPLKLAEIILGNRQGWSRAQVDEAIASGKMRQVNLSKPLPVLVLYWTVDPNPDGTARFYEDIYGRDKGVLKALNAPFAPAR